MKEDLMFCSMGNGITICDRNREEHSDYKTVAHIGYNRDITYYEKGLSREAISSIEQYARYNNSAASQTQHCPVLKPVEFSKLDVQELKGIFTRVLRLRFKDVGIEVASCPDMGYITVFSNKESCMFLSEYYRYMQTGIKEGVHHHVFTLYDKANTNY